MILIDNKKSPMVFVKPKRYMSTEKFEKILKGKIEGSPICFFMFHRSRDLQSFILSNEVSELVDAVPLRPFSA